MRTAFARAQTIRREIKHKEVILEDPRIVAYRDAALQMAKGHFNVDIPVQADGAVSELGLALLIDNESDIRRVSSGVGIGDGFEAF